MDRAQLLTATAEKRSTRGRAQKEGPGQGHQGHVPNPPPLTGPLLNKSFSYKLNRGFSIIEVNTVTIHAPLQEALHLIELGIQISS